jgi:steroid 5-alpha reductase family enzyme
LKEGTISLAKMPQTFWFANSCKAAIRSFHVENTDQRSIIGIIIILVIAAGLAAAGSQGGYVVSGIPLFALCIAIAFIIQFIAFIPAFLQQTETFFDLTGSITYLTVTLVAVLFSRAADARAYLLAALVAVWAIRLGTFLFQRVRAAGEDRRFREIKTSFFRFLVTWTLQGLWVSFTLAAALAAITTENKVELGVFALVGLIVWVLGFGIEVVADGQKSQFRANPENAGKFINTGLWAWSRHPNYFGEIILWIGVAIIAAPTLRGWQWLTMVSPVFIVILLTRISGVPMLEERADKKWGGQPEYEDYKAKTPVLIPRPPSG